MKRSVFFITLVLFSLVPLFCLYGAEHIVLYGVGEKDPGAWGLLRKYFQTKGYSLNIYDGTSNMERHIENVNSINRGKSGLLLAIDFHFGDGNDVLVAVAEGKRGRGNILSVEQVVAVHGDDSRECAKAVAGSFGRTAKELPLFPMMGVNMPGIFVKMECTKEKTLEMLGTLDEGLRRYFARGAKNEN
jgi:hypothetical protein